MAIKHIKKYYEEISKLYFDFVDDLNVLQEDLKNGDITQEQLDNFLLPYNNLKNNYVTLSYIMHLLVQPNKDSKQKQFEKQNKDRVQFFKENNVEMENVIEDCNIKLKDFDKVVKEWKESIKNDN